MHANDNVCVVILTMGNVEDTLKCIASLRKSTFTNFEVVVVENSLTTSFAELDDGIKRIVAGGNIGFAAGNNLGIRWSLQHEFFATMLLNDDMLVDEEMLGSLVQVLKTHPRVGLVGPVTFFLRNPEQIWAAGGNVYPLNIRIEGRRQKIKALKTVGYIPASGLMFKNEIVLSSGELEEKYFFAYEEAEFAIRARRLGYCSVVDPNALAWHKVGMSSQVKPKLAYNDLRNRFLFDEFLYGRTVGRLMARLLVLRHWLPVASRYPKLANRAWKDHLTYPVVRLDHLNQVEKEFPTFA